jgi:NIMA (never in mitosis gene a)-related kinase
LHCLRCLRFLYSVEKNRKPFKQVYPHEIFGAFIDVGNYNKDFESYIPLLKKFNMKLPVKTLEQIKQNFESMNQFYRQNNLREQKVIGEY